MTEETQVVETQEVPLGESSMAEFKKARAEGKESVVREAAPAVEEAEVEEDGKESKPKAKGGFQARIDRLIKQQAAVEAERDAARKEAEELKAKLNGKDAPKKSEGEPQRADFQSDSEYVKALVKYERGQELAREQQEEYQATVKEQIDRYNTRMIALQADNDEYKELMNQSTAIPKVLEVPITREMENGPEVAIFLAQNPDICQEMVEASPSKAIAMAWNISERLEKEAKGEPEAEKEEKEEKQAKEPEKKAKLAPPIKPVSNSGMSKSTIPLDRTDFQAYKKLRSQGRVQ